MKNEKLLDMFKCSDVELMSIEELTKLGLEGVPTILIINISPSQEIQKGIYVQKQAFTWVENVINNRRLNMIKHTENTKKLIEMHEMKKRMQDGLLGYSNMETNGISDDYAFWSDKPEIDVNLNMAQSKSFSGYDKDINEYIRQHNQTRIMTIPDIEGTKQERKKLKGYIITDVDQKKMLSELKTNRKNQLNGIKDQMQKEQISSVLNGENRFFQNKI
jgi:hypothetical protein